MNMRIAIALTAFVTITSGAVAGDSDDLAERLGQVLAAEEPCSLTFDTAAIQAFIEKHVKADDMDFAGRLDTETKVGIMSIGSMTTSSKVAYCTQESRVAKSFGFIK